MKNRIFSILQRLGRSFMLPIAILPIAGLLLSIGSTFTNPTMLSSLHLDGIISSGSILYCLFTIMTKVGACIFQNLPLIFAAGVALGMAKKEQGVAVLSAIIAFFVMHTTINSMLTINGQILANQTLSPTVLEGTIVSICGIQTLEMGVFGGIIVGLGVSYLHNRFHNIHLPNTISFFGGTRFIPIISTLTFLCIGILMFYIWPHIQNSIYALGQTISDSGYAGTFFFGLIKRLLVPFGLHHVFYLPFWQTALGGSMLVNGVMVHGGQNIFFAQLADPQTIQFSSEATRYFSGEFIFMMFGLPGAALAMYHCSKKENKKIAGGLLFTAALTSILTGITEPIEFSFLFVAPMLFGVQVVLAASAYMIAHIYSIAVGLTFSGGLIDFIMFGILQGNDKTNWMIVIPLGILYFIIYYGCFRFLIIKYDLKTLGRGKKEDLIARSNHENRIENKEVKEVSQQILLIAKGLGGRNNFSELDCCITRLRATINDPLKVNEGIIKQSGAAGMLLQGNSIQIIYGPQASLIKTQLEDYLDYIPDSFEEDMTIDNPVLELGNVVNGIVSDISESSDILFSQGKMGDGVIIKPTVGLIVAPCDGTITLLYPTKHAIGIRLNNGCEILLHFGVNSVSLNGEGFELLVQLNQSIKKGDIIWNADLDYIRSMGLDESIIIVVTKLADNLKIEKSYGTIDSGDKIISFYK